MPPMTPTFMRDGNQSVRIDSIVGIEPLSDDPLRGLGDRTMVLLEGGHSTVFAVKPSVIEKVLFGFDRMAEPGNRVIDLRTVALER